METRVCQFNLRGRCSREDCEFKHQSPEEGKAAADPSSSSKTPEEEKKKQPCRFFKADSSCPSGDSCEFSHETAPVDDDGQSPGESPSSPEGDLEEVDEDLVLEESPGDAPKTAPKIRDQKTTTIEDLSKEWTDDEEEDDPSSGGEVVPAEEDNNNSSEAPHSNVEEVIPTEEDNSEALPPEASVPTVIASKEAAAPSSETPSSGVPEEEEDKPPKEEWVTLIFGEDGKPSEEGGTAEGVSSSSVPPSALQESITLGSPKEANNVYDLNTETDMDKGERQWPIRRRGGGARVRGGFRNRPKREGVTKIGNNMYFYTGDDEKAEVEEEEEEASDAEYLKKDNSAGEDKGGESTKVMVARKRGRPRKQQQPPFLEELILEVGEDDPSPLGSSSGQRPKSLASEDAVVKPKRKVKKHRPHRKDYVYAGKSSAAKTRRCGECENCNREDCNKCDACRDKPRNGGKGLKKQACIYRVCLWKNPSGKTANNVLPIKRPRGRPRTRPPGLIKAPSRDSPKQESQKTVGGTTLATSSGRLSLPVIDPKSRMDADLPSFDPDKFKPGFNPTVVKKGDSEYVVVVTGVKDTGLCGKYWGNSESLRSKRRLRLSGEEEEESILGDVESSPDLLNSSQISTSALETPPAPLAGSGKRGKRTLKESPAGVKRLGKRKSGRRSEGEEASSSSSKKAREEETILPDSGGSLEANASAYEPRDKNDKSADGSSIRSVSCVADTSTQREVTVECFAPYDDHRWVNIGKERDNMAPDSVMYARALRPPYHLLSFLRIKGNSTKGMSCTDRNTMVFVVLEGEISVVLHTTQFSASKGDSFYIPPKNYYNLINQKVREAELSLIQFQYDGPLPTVAACSQSGGGGGSGPAPTPAKP
eukprot:TRINITY_DN414_c0_g1_i1.p1 TRINITY_DN414_c0_g1~~TRINITY_DN414_c0_g1_i1.p1  ORF type:complete len:876 (-),score=342.27 TRINITY_DN414_c0_g1_i1:817-3444(-)